MAGGALEIVTQSRTRGDQVALLLADRRMTPGPTVFRVRIPLRQPVRSDQ
jgi:hypothetical protein